MMARHNLARRPHENRAPWWLALAVLLAVLLVRLAFSVPGMSALAVRASHEKSLADRNARIAALKEEKERLTEKTRSESWRRFATDAELAAGLLERRNFSWIALLERLEACKPYQSYFTSVHPGFGADGVRVELKGVATSHAELLDLEKRFMASPWFEGLSLKADERVGPSSAEFDFTVSVNYIEAGDKAEQNLPVTIGVVPKGKGR